MVAKKAANATKTVNFGTNRVCKPWSSQSQDGKELKVYIELGFVDGFKINEILHKYPQFNAYDKKTISNTVTRWRDALSKNLESRQNLANGCKYVMKYYMITIFEIYSYGFI